MRGTFRNQRKTHKDRTLNETSSREKSKYDGVNLTTKNDSIGTLVANKETCHANNLLNTIRQSETLSDTPQTTTPTNRRANAVIERGNYKGKSKKKKREEPSERNNRKERRKKLNKQSTNTNNRQA